MKLLKHILRKSWKTKYSKGNLIMPLHTASQVKVYRYKLYFPRPHLANFYEQHK